MTQLESIFDHEEISFDPSELARINDSFRIYSGKYDAISYVNSYGEIMERPYMTLNMMNEVSKHLGSILFNEQCEISFRKNSVDEGFITGILQNNNFIKKFSEYVQVMLATGGLAVKPYYDASSGEIKFAWVLADTFVPLHSNTNNISEAAITSSTQVSKGSKTFYYTLLEFHTWQDQMYVISNELYKSEYNDKLGEEVGLDELYEGLEQVTFYENFSRPNFAYLKPFGFNNICPQSPLGLGVCDNAKTTLEQINNTYDQYYWEIRQGKRRVVVSDHFMRTRIDPSGRPSHYFDAETDVYLALPTGIDDMQYKDITSDIRSQQYIESINKFISTAEMQVGLSAGTFTFDGKSVKTATEVISEDSMTYRTRSSHLTNIEEFIQELIISTCELARETYTDAGTRLYSGNIPDKKDIIVDFDDGVFDDKTSELDYWSKAVLAKLAPRSVAMSKVHNITEDEVKKWMAQMKEEEVIDDPFLQQREAESSLLGDFKE